MIADVFAYTVVPPRKRLTALLARGYAVRLHRKADFDLRLLGFMVLSLVVSPDGRESFNFYH